MPKHRPLYYLVAPAGIPNYGDELIASTWIRYLAEVAPEADVVLDCFNPAGIAGPLSTIHSRLRIVSTLWQLCFRNWSVGVGAADAVETAIADPYKTPDLADQIELVRRADVVHLVGGGFVNDVWPACLGLLSGITMATGASGGLAAMTGQGLYPPARGTQDRLRELVAKFDVVDVRDEPSRRLAGPSASASCDDVFLRTEPSPMATGEVPELMVSVQSMLAGVPASELVDFVAKTVAAWGARTVGLLECSPEHDADILAVAERVLPTARRYDMAEVLRDGLPVAAGQCWLATRFHPHLVAAAYGASGVVINLGGEYYGTKHRSLIAQGSRWTLQETLRIPPKPTAGGFIPAEIAELHRAKTAVAERIYAPASVPG